MPEYTGLTNRTSGNTILPLWFRWGRSDPVNPYDFNKWPET